MNDFDIESRYSEFYQSQKEHPEWYIVEDIFVPQSETRVKSLAWNGKPGIDIYINMVNKEYTK